MANAIFVTVFLQVEYLKLFYLFIQSLRKYGNDYDIIVYTSGVLEDEIRESELLTDRMKFVINDQIKTISQACKSRLDIFNFDITSTYEKILYMDTDILVEGSLQPVFDSCTKDVLYALEEGTVNAEGNYYGRSYFGDELDKYGELTAFNAGVLLFKTSDIIKNLFAAINEDTRVLPEVFVDQAYINHRAIKMNLYDNQVMKKYIVDMRDKEPDGHIILHFPGLLGNGLTKERQMLNWLQNKSTKDSRQ